MELNQYKTNLEEDATGGNAFSDEFGTNMNNIKDKNKIEMLSQVFDFNRFGLTGVAKAENGHITELSNLMFLDRSTSTLGPDGGTHSEYTFRIPRITFHYNIMAFTDSGVKTTVTFTVYGALLTVSFIGNTTIGTCSLSYRPTRVTLRAGEYDYDVGEIETDTVIVWPLVQSARPVVSLLVRFYMGENGELLRNIESLLAWSLGKYLVKPAWEILNENNPKTLCDDINSS